MVGKIIKFWAFQWCSIFLYGRRHSI